MKLLRVDVHDVPVAHGDHVRARRVDVHASEPRWGGELGLAVDLVDSGGLVIQVLP